MKPDKHLQHLWCDEQNPSKVCENGYFIRSATKSKSLFYIPLPTIFHLVVVYDNDWWLPDPQTTFQNQSGSLISAQWGKSGGQGWLGY